MQKWIKILLLVIGVILLLLVAFVSVTVFQHNEERDEVNKEYQAYHPPQITGIGTTQNLSILPLVNWHSANPNLKTEMGVSYLIKTDSATILFDLGQNADEENPSPL